MDNCLPAARWLLVGGMAELGNVPVIVVGESAGGYLAATTTRSPSLQQPCAVGYTDDRGDP